jgi:hypothetical protein
VEVSGNASTTTTVTIKARSQDDADALVKDDLDSYVDGADVLRDHIRYNGFDDLDVEVQ